MMPWSRGSHTQQHFPRENPWFNPHYPHRRFLQLPPPPPPLSLSHAPSHGEFLFLNLHYYHYWSDLFFLEVVGKGFEAGEARPSSVEFANEQFEYFSLLNSIWKCPVTWQRRRCIIPWIIAPFSTDGRRIGIMSPSFCYDIREDRI